MKNIFIKILFLAFMIGVLILEQFAVIGSASSRNRLVIVEQPKNSYSAKGEKFTIKVKANGDGLKYQWWIKNTDNKKFYKSSIKTSSYSTVMDSARNGRKLYCVITDKYGRKIVSDTITIKMIKKLSIQKQPLDTKYYIGEKTDIKIEATGESVKYQWWVKNLGSNKFYKSSITGKKYITVMSDKSNGRKIYCVVSDKYGNKITSKTVTIGMKNKISVLKQPKSSNCLSGNTVRLSVSAKGDGLKYQWWVRDRGSDRFYKSSIKSSEYKASMNEQRNGRYLYCEITDKYGCKVLTEIVSINLLNKTDCKKHKYGKEMPVCNNNDGYKFEKTCSLCGAVKSVYYDAMISFVDDDGKVDALKYWERIMDATGINVTSAIIPSRIPEITDYEGYWSYAGWDYINQLKAKGMDFVNHTYNHINLTKLTREEIIEDFKTSKEVLSSKGVNSEILVYPNTAYNDTVLSVVPDYFKSAVACGGVVNKPDFNNIYKLNRVDLNSSKVVKEIDFGDKTVKCNGIHSLEKLKSYSDKTLSQKGWLMFMTHAYNSPAGKTYFDSESEQIIIDFCKYVLKSKNIKFATLTEGVNLISAYN